jgi:integrase
MHLETAPPGEQKQSTKIPIGHTAAERKASRALAETHYHEHALAPTKQRQGIAPAGDPGMTFDAFATWYDANVIEHHKGRERERAALPRLRDAFGSRRLTDPDWKTAVLTWRTERRKTGTRIKHFGGPNGKPRQLPPPSANTVNREVALLQAMLTSAVENGYLTASPLYGLPDLDVVKPVRRIMSEAEEQAVAAELGPEDQAIFLVGLDALVRLTDILDLRRSDDHGDTIDIRDPKNGQPLTVPVSARLRAALDAVPRPAGDWYFPGRRGAATERDRRGGYAKALARACRRAGVAYGRRQHGLTFHWATRRTGATRMIRRLGEKGIGIVQRVGGWKDPAVLIGIYQETDLAEMRAAVESVSAGLPPLPPPAPALTLVKAGPTLCNQNVPGNPQNGSKRVETGRLVRVPRRP